MVEADFLEGDPRDERRQVLADRLRAIALIRGILVLLVAAYLSTTGWELVETGNVPLLLAAGVLALAFTVSVPMWAPATHRAILDLSLVVDAGVLGILLAVTGGAASPFTPLVVVVALLALMAFGWRTGVRAAVAVSVSLGWVWAASPQSASVGEASAAVPQAAMVADTRVAVVLLATWAAVGGVALLARVVERDLRRAADDTDAVHRIGRTLLPEQGPEGVAAQLADATVAHLSLPTASVWLTDREHAGLILAATARRSGNPTPADGRELERSDLVTRALASRHPVTTDATGQLREVHGPGPLALIRLQAAGAAHGVLVVRPSSGRQRVDDHLARALEEVGDDAAVTLDAAHSLATLRAQARTDPVTGVPNHRVMQERLRSELARLDRLLQRGRPASLSLTLLDLDHFKRVNDTHGHPTGDAVLAAVADALGRAVRLADVVCRYGGEEFAVVLPDTDADEARAACERFRRVVAGVRVTAPDGTAVAVTASFGVASVVAAGVQRDDLLEAADRALYQAKRNGRDRVEVAGAVAPIIRL